MQVLHGACFIDPLEPSRSVLSIRMPYERIRAACVISAWRRSPVIDACPYKITFGATSSSWFSPQVPKHLLFWFASWTREKGYKNRLNVMKPSLFFPLKKPPKQQNSEHQALAHQEKKENGCGWSDHTSSSSWPLLLSQQHTYKTALYK